MKTGTYSKNVNEHTLLIKITTSQNVLVQRCIGAVIMSFPGLKETYFLNREAWVDNEKIYRKISMAGMPLSQNTKQLPELPCTKTLL